ncbi:cupin domain-containing protein [Actinocrispum wychmicini]|uniref:Cytoplasmic protein n=1 Tax=Actinocrispum wychmicini TaxID=1213861 RepID=A0A4R2JUN8_9PSEU|nr:cytoplasmic protein [Actinocrispum wychmicini]TCO60749.1 hypothetical protein EV192_103324 [Actinocrispum wychmicini]
MRDNDPLVTNPELYTLIFENDRVRVLRYLDHPGDRTAPHSHPDSVMVTLSDFTRRITAGEREVEVDLPAGQARWVAAQQHAGENIGTSRTHSIFIELKEPQPAHLTTPIDTIGPTSH